MRAAGVRQKLKDHAAEAGGLFFFTASSVGGISGFLQGLEKWIGIH
jgi:hypothetical protein